MKEIQDLNTFIQNMDSPSQDQVYAILGPLRRAILQSIAPLLNDSNFHYSQVNFSEFLNEIMCKGNSKS